MFADDSVDRVEATLEEEVGSCQALGAMVILNLVLSNFQLFNLQYLSAKAEIKSLVYSHPNLQNLLVLYRMAC